MPRQTTRQTMRQIEVAAALLSHEGRVLVQKRPATKTRGALWEFPGGKLEPGEDGPTALARECREELGVNVEVGAEVWSTSHRYEDAAPITEVQLRLFRCRLIEGTPRPLEKQELRWAKPDELSELPFVAADIPVLALIADGEIPL
jgi:mutator protein MutT